MRKVTKILAKLLSATILLLIILPLSLSLLLSLNSVQGYVVERFAQIASRKIGAHLAIGGVSYTMPKDIVLHDLLIEDQGGDTMIYSSRLQGRISALSLLKDQLIIDHVAVKDAKVQLREMDSNVLNIKQIVMRITKEDGDAKFKTVINRIDVENLDFSLKRKVSLKREYGVDLSDICIEGINGSISSLISHQRITEFSIDSFEGREKSGFDIRSLRTKFATYIGVVDFVDFMASTSASSVNLSNLRLESDRWEDYKDFNNNVSIELHSNYSSLAASDVAYFAPALRDVDFVVNGVLLSLNGTVNNLDAQLENLSFGASSLLRGDLVLQDITQIDMARFSLDIDRLDSSLPDIETLLNGFGTTPLAPAARTAVGALGDMRLKGSAAGSFDKVNLTADLSSKQGSIRYSGTVEDLRGDIGVAGELSTVDLNLGAMLSNRALGATTLSSNVEYRRLADGFNSRVEGAVQGLTYNSCRYSDIDFNLAYNGDKIDGAISSHDAALDFDLVALVALEATPRYDLTMRVNRADLKAMALNKRDSLSSASGSLRVNLSGSTLDDMNGSVVVRNINYKYNEESVYAPMIDIVARNSADSKYIGLKSDYLDVTFNSKSSYEALYNYLKDGIKKYIPLLYTSSTERKSSRRVTIADNYSTLSVDFKDFSKIGDALSEGLNIADNSSFNLMVNPFSERFSLRLRSDYIEHRKLAATELNVNASNDNDSLSLYATATDLFVGRNSLSSASVMAGARNNVVELSAGFRDSLASLNATLGLRVTFDGYQRANIALLPSQISMEDQMWMLSAKEISGNGARLEVEDFAMVNGSQRLMINGAISKDPADMVTLTLEDYNIAMLTSVVNNLGYSVDGLSSGYIKMQGLLGSPRIVADVKLDEVEVNSIPSPPLDLSAGWDTKENRAMVFVTHRINQDTVVTGYYAPTDNRYYAKLKVDSVNLGLIDPLLKTTITNTRGYGDIDVTLRGRDRDASLNGAIDIYDATTKVIFTQVEYSIPSARIDVEDNRLSSYAQRMYDADRNSGLITFNLSLDHLSNVSYSMRIVPENMLVLNTTEQDNELFYGKLYASGVATIKGDKRGVDMDITATSKPNSSFFMPLSTQSAIANTDFITFVQKRSSEQRDNSVNFRKQYIDERNRRMTNQSASQVNINMALHATPDLDFQIVIDPVVGDIIKAKGEGRLNLNIAPMQNLFEMYGDYNITEGSYLFSLLNPISKRFVIESGSSIHWSGDAIDPTLNIDAVYKVKTSLDPLTGDSSSSRAVPVDCIIHLGDRLSQPSVEFSIEVPTADTEQQAVIANTLIDQETISQQFFYLMFANSFIPVSTSYGSGLASTTTASTGFELLTNQLSNWLSSSNYNVVIRYRPESELTSDEVDLGFSRGLIDNRLLIEVEGNYLADNKAASVDDSYSNFMGEAYITWLIDKGGALRLKGFTQTIDRYDENQGLQETGIGLYYSESFNNFKELKRKILSRFKRRKDDEDDADDEN